MIELLTELRAAGIRIIEPRPNGNVYVAPKACLTPELVERIRAHKAALLALLTRPETPAESCPCCHGRAFWRTSGPWVCERCHPPISEPAERFALPGPAPSVSAVAPNSRQPLIPPSVRTKIAAVELEARAKGWPPELLWSGGFWGSSPRGLASVIDPEDEIAEITPDYIAIVKCRRDLLRFRRYAA